MTISILQTPEGPVNRPAMVRGITRPGAVLVSRSMRVLLMLIAFCGSAVYAASYRMVTGVADLTPIAAAIGVSAAVAWIGFGFLLLMVAQMHPKRFARVTVWHWVDACLITMALGMAIKMLGVGANVIAAGMAGDRVDLALMAPLHLVILIITDGAMGLAFTRLTARLGLPTRMAVLLWIAALNGLFASVLISLLYGVILP